METMAANLKQTLLSALVELDKTPPEELLKVRYARLMQYGKFEEA